MQAYGVDYLEGIFKEFVRECALVLQLFLDGTPLKMFHEGRVVNVEVYCRLLLAYGDSGVCKRNFPTLAVPPDSTAAGIVSILPLSGLYIDDLTVNPGFKFLFINCDGANTNRKAIRMLMSELQNRRDLLVVVNFCSAHAMNRAVKWGLGVFYYGDFPRCCHVLQAAKHPHFEDHVRNMLHIEVQDDSYLFGETAQDYLSAVQFQYGYARGLAGSQSERHYVSAPAELSDENVLWRRLVRLILGDKGPYTKRSKTLYPSWFQTEGIGLFLLDVYPINNCLRLKNTRGAIADKCHRLWPGGIPREGEKWYCAPGCKQEDYLDIVRSLFRKTVPTPVSSRWHDTLLRGGMRIRD